MNATLRTIGWGLFCTSSWTWCIGMWLPLIMIMRWGWMGFWAFAIPNIIGCVAMGYITGSRSRSEQLVEKHRGPMRWFSVVTISFQLFWITVLAGFIASNTTWFNGINIAWIVLVPAAVLLLAAVVSLLPSTGWLLFGTLAYCYMLGAFGTLGTVPLEQIRTTGSYPEMELWGALPIIVLGFLLSPYLDLTFHRARRETPSSHSFAIFGGSFLVVLLFVASYYEAVEIDMTGVDLFELVAAFWIGQVIYTIGAHLRELRSSSGPGGWGATSLLVGLSAAPALVVWVFLVAGSHLDVSSQDGSAWVGSSLQEKNYLRFLAFYGLIVPAWVLAFMGPRRPARRTNGGMLALAISLLIAMPLAELGMNQGVTWWIIPSVLVVMCTALLLPRGERSGGMITR